jgi:uncharacterized protein (TIGR00266 family)
VKYELLYRPTFSAARVMLDPGDAVRAEAGAMVSMSPTITIDSKVTGGLGKAFGRLLGGESLFQTTFTATHGPGEVVLAPSSLGDLIALDLGAGPGYMLTSGCFLACDTSVQMETKVSGRGFFAGEGLFLLRMSGVGTVLTSAFGAIHALQLAPGQTYVVDTGHIVAFSETMNYQVRTVTRGLLASFTSGEGFVAEFMGPGILYMQTRAPQSFGPWLSQYIPRGS